MATMLNDSQSKITSFFRRPNQVSTQIQPVSNPSQDSKTKSRRSLRLSQLGTNIFSSNNFVQNSNLTRKKDTKIVYAVKDRAAKKLPLCPEVITINCDDNKPKVVETQVVYSKLWSETYQSNTSEEFLDHCAAYESIKLWLSSWKDKFQKNNDDYCDIPNKKSLFIYGPNGVGKTSIVYAIAKECGYKVVEHNSSCQKLTPAVLNKDFLESVQSHCIGGNKINNFFKSNINKNNVESTNAGISKSLILFDDIDAILYEDRSDLWKAIRQLIRDSRKPIIFTSSFHLNFLTLESDIFHKINFKALNHESIRNKLHNILKKEFEISENLLLERFLFKKTSINGDARKAINDIQFWSKKHLFENENCSHRKSPEDDFIDIQIHSNLIDLLSLEDCLNSSQQKMMRNIDDFIYDYNFYTYHNRPSLLLDPEDKYYSFQMDLIECLHESHSIDPNYDRYSHDIKHFYN